LQWRGILDFQKHFVFMQEPGQRTTRLGRSIIAALVLAAFTHCGMSQTPDVFDPTVDYDVNAMAVQPDGRILLGGYFSNLGGKPCSYLGRLSPTGELDATFSPAVSGGVDCFAVQDDGKLLVGGEFGTVAGQSRLRLARFNTDGSLDTSFNPGVSDAVFCLAVQPDGRILVGGHFTTLAGQPRSNLGRLYLDGTLDATFRADATKTSYSSVNCLALQPDGGIVVGGNFGTLGGQARTNIGRLDSAGNVDMAFNPGAGDSYYRPASLLVQPDGKILVAGAFSALGGQPVNNLGRLNIDGTLDTNFNAAAGTSVMSLALQTDGKVLAAGAFTNLSGAPRTYIGRLNADGAADPTFDPLPSTGTYPHPQMVPYVISLGLQADGNIIAAGRFQTFAGQTRTNIGRLVNTEGATQSLQFDGSSIVWLRGGTSPEVWRSRFDASTNGTDWLSLGPLMRITGGWRVSGLSLPTNATIRARGFVTGGYCNSSTWTVESVIGPPGVVTGPCSRTNNAGSVATFSVQAVGTGSLSYAWRKDGLNLADAGDIAGTQTSTLTLSNVLGATAGGYSVVVSNALGSVTSLVARLTVVDPWIVTPPMDKAATQGQTAKLTVSALGTASLSYQWRHNEINLTAGSTSSLTLTNLQAADVGSYDVIVSNAFGCVTSRVAVLTVNLITVDPSWSGGVNYIDSMALLKEGKVVVSGSFTSPFSYVAQLNIDGSVDWGFHPGANNCMAYSLAVQPDGMILMGGDITSTPGQRIRRLTPGGVLDTNFSGDAGYEMVCLALQPDGKILAGGSFNTLTGQPRNGIGRLNANGTLDTDFNPGAGGTVITLALQPDGKILVGGSFTNLGGAPASLIGRLKPDGRPDPGFAASAAGSAVNCLALQADGKILVGGSFSSLGGLPRNGVGRLNPDGSVDAAFNPALGGSSAAAYCLVLQADGQIIVAGYFTSLGGLTRTNIGRLNPDGSVDLTFNPSTAYITAAYPVALQDDGRILIGAVKRFNNTTPATQTLTVDAAGITWMRGGSSPEVWRTTFERSDNGTDWTMLGEGVRFPGGWRCAAVAGINTNTTVRGRGYATGSKGNRSAWFVETSLQVTQLRPAILAHDEMVGFRTNLFGFDVVGFSGQTVVVEASADLTNWVPVGTNLFGPTPQYFCDRATPLPQKRFYRAKVQ
jgi:uncharacterized delta-60 repeat protein